MTETMVPFTFLLLPGVRGVDRFSVLSGTEKSMAVSSTGDSLGDTTKAASLDRYHLHIDDPRQNMTLITLSC